MSRTKPESLDEILSSIAESIDSTSTVVETLENDFSLEKKEEYPEIIKNILNTLESDSSSNSLDSVSLLSLKNSSLLGYVTDLALLLATRLESIKNVDEKKSIKEGKNDLLSSIVTNRVVLEKGVKSLEKKINYQLEKMVNTYHRREKEQEDLKNKVSEVDENAGSEAESEAENDGDDDDEEEEEEEEGLNFRPNPSALLKQGTFKGSKESKESKQEYDEDGGEEEEDGSSNSRAEKSKEKYKPPKISAAAINDPDKETKGRKQRNLQSMDEYLQDISEAPTIEKSIGSTIINNGRDVKSKKQMEKEAEIQRYEEENFTRLPTTKTKENKRERAKRMRNEFFGEDWSMFENGGRNDGNNTGGNKKRKRLSAWERAKRKIDD